MFALVDCDNFYASCECVFDPSLEGKPVIVLSNNDGCAISRSEEAKAIGIKMATPAFIIEDLIKKYDVKVFSSNYTLYGDMSSRVMNILSEFTPDIAYHSIDEAFLDLSSLKYQDLNGLAVKIKDTIKQYTGLPVTVGIAPTKTLAKLASRFARKKKITPGIHCLLNPIRIQELLDHSKISDVWGLDHHHEKLLLKHHVKTAADFIKLPEEWIGKNMPVVGQRMLNELCGLPSIKWEDQPPGKKGICTSYTINGQKTIHMMPAPGKDMVRFTVHGYKKKWKLQATRVSKRYTTNINELLTIKI